MCLGSLPLNITLCGGMMKFTNKNNRNVFRCGVLDAVMDLHSGIFRVQHFVKQLDHWLRLCAVFFVQHDSNVVFQVCAVGVRFRCCFVDSFFLVEFRVPINENLRLSVQASVSFHCREFRNAVLLPRASLIRTFELRYLRGYHKLAVQETIDQ